MSERLPTSLPEVTPRQREVARLVAQGMTNEEIAAHLDISLAGAKYHVSELLGRLGAQRRDEIADWYRRGGTERPRPWLRWQRAAIALAAGILGAGTVAVVAVGLPGGAAPSQSGADTTGREPSEAAYRSYTAEELERLGFAEFGPFLTADEPVEMHMRAGFVALRVAGGATISTRAPSGTWNVSGCCGLAATLHLERGEGDEWLWATLYSGDGRLAQVVGTPPPVALMVGEADAGPEHVGLEVRRGGWESAGRLPLAVAVDERGYLFLSKEPIDLVVPIELSTSERVDVARATRLGSLGGDVREIASHTRVMTRCLDLDVCEGGYGGYLPLLAPMDGEVVCVQPGTFELRASSVTLRFAAPQPLCPADIPQTVREGSAIPFDPRSVEMTTGWVVATITAVDPDGKALDVAVGGDGTLYVGDIEAHIDCPCRVFH